MKNLIIILLVSISFSCTNKEKASDSPLVNIDLNNLEGLQGLPPLDELSAHIEYIKMETDSRSLIGFFHGMEYTRNYLFIKSTHDLLMFERGTGKFVCKVGNRGKGPGEYQGFKEIEVDGKSNQIYLWDYFKKQFLIYNFQGKFVSAFGIEGLGVDYPGKFKLLDNNRIIVYNNNDMGNGTRQLLLVDKKGDVLDSLPNKHQFKVVFPLHTIRNQNNHLKILNNNEISFKYKRDDTLYHIPVADKLELMPAYVFTTKEKVKHKYSDREYAFLTELNETDKYFFFNHRGHFLMYDKEKGQLMATAYKEREGIENNIDGGLPFWPRYAQGNTLATFYNALELKEKLTPEHFGQATAKSPKKKEALQELVNSLQIDDNPVVMIVTLKE